MNIDPQTLSKLYAHIDLVEDGLLTSDDWLIMAYDASIDSPDEKLSLNALIDQLAAHQGGGLVYAFFEDALLSALEKVSALKGPALDTLAHYLLHNPDRRDYFHKRLVYNRTRLHELADFAQSSLPRLWVLQAISGKTLTRSNTILIELLEKSNYASSHLDMLSSPASKDMLEGVRAAYPYTVSQGKAKAYSTQPGFARLMHLLYPTATHFHGVVGEVFHHLIGNILGYRSTRTRDPAFSSLSDIEDTFQLMELSGYPKNTNALTHYIEVTFKRHINEGMDDREWSRGFIAPRLEALFTQLDNYSSIWRLILLGHLHPVDREPFKEHTLSQFDSLAKALCHKLSETGTRRLPKLLCEMLLSEMDHEHVITLLKDDSAALSALYQFSGDKRLLPMMNNEHRRQSLTGDLGL